VEIASKLRETSTTAYLVPTMLMEFAEAAFNAALSQFDAKKLKALEAARQRA